MKAIWAAETRHLECLLLTKWCQNRFFSFSPTPFNLFVFLLNYVLWHQVNYLAINMEAHFQNPDGSSHWASKEMAHLIWVNQRPPPSLWTPAGETEAGFICRSLHNSSFTFFSADWNWSLSSVIQSANNHSCTSSPSSIISEALK